MRLTSLVLAATLASLPHPDPAEADLAGEESAGEPDFALVINRALASAKGEEVRALAELRRQAQARPERWPRHERLRLEVLARTVELERDELEARCAELASEPGSPRPGDWSPALTLDAETLARAAATRLALEPGEAAALHVRLHALLSQLRLKEAGVRALEVEVVPLAREAYQAAAQAVAAGQAAPREAVDAAELLYDRRQALVAARVERELVLTQLAQLTGLALAQPAAPLRCGGTEL